MEKPVEYSYWKRPWHKWAILIVAILQLISLWMNIREYEQIAQAGILSAAAWESYTAQHNLQCAITGLMAVCFAGPFVIGCFAKERKSARLAEGLFLLFLAAAWGIIGWTVLQLNSSLGSGLFWALILILSLSGGLWDVWRYRKKE